MPHARVILLPRKARPFHGRHPWVLETAIQRVDGETEAGDVVDLISDSGQWVARGIINPASRLRVRLYSWREDEELDDAFWRARLQQARALRESLGYLRPGGGARLVYSESDGVSGLVVDRFGDYLVMHVTAQAIAARVDRLIPLLVEIFHPKGILVRSDPESLRKERLHLAAAGAAWGTLPEGPVFFDEHGIRYGVDLHEGQKTGFYLDQRENRRCAAALAADKRVLDVCCYTGGFSLAAAIVGSAREVLGIDSSSKAIAMARAHAQLNGVANVHFEEADAFLRLAQLSDEGHAFGLVIVDPPKFARRREGVADALRAYHQLNQLAVSVTQANGFLVTCSCSGYVSRDEFAFMLAEVARTTRREIQFLEVRGAAPDHPVSATCLETEYLKCFVCRVR